MCDIVPSMSRNRHATITLYLFLYLNLFLSFSITFIISYQMLQLREKMNKQSKTIDKYASTSYNIYIIKQNTRTKQVCVIFLLKWFASARMIK